MRSSKTPSAFNIFIAAMAEYPVANNGSKSKTYRSEMSYGNFWYKTSGNLLASNSSSSESKLSIFSSSSTGGDSRRNKSLPRPSLSLLFTKILPILMPLQHALNAFSIASPLRIIDTPHILE